MRASLERSSGRETMTYRPRRSITALSFANFFPIIDEDFASNSAETSVNARVNR